MCPACKILYESEIRELVEGTGTNRRSVKCDYIQFPNHPQARFRRPCGTPVLSTVKRGRKGLDFKPRKVYCYYGIKAALANLLKDPEFLRTCNSWKDRQSSCSMMSDIIDGKVWQDQIQKLTVNGSNCNVLGFLLNIDWFQPFKDIAYSIGMIYAVILNLPRDVRYKDNNVIIIGVIPGPKEPKHDVNSNLGPLVQELLELYTGVWFDASHGQQFVRGVLLCFSSDVPATRKAAGFVGHNSIKGCSRCLKSFLTNSENMTDYSGYNRDSWVQRTNAIHRQYAYKELVGKMKAEKKVIERMYGARYSILFELPYYDCIRFVVIDVMHNLFLGTAKHALNVWKEKKLLDAKDFEEIQRRVNTFNVPQDIGRIPYKIDSGMAGMTADQWKNWTCIYSLHALHGILPNEHLDYWWLFVQACIILCQPFISHSDIDRGDHFLLEFCRQFEQLCGKEYCTPNMHLRCHIAECLYDYGPAHTTWCFSFERCNGILGNMPNNNKSLAIEKTMITRFIITQQMEHSKSNTTFSDNISSFFPESLSGSLNEPMAQVSLREQMNLSMPLPITNIPYNNSIITPIGPMREYAMNEDMVKCLTRMYEILFSDCTVIHTTSLCQRFVRVKVGIKLYSSKMARTDRSTFICAHWLKNDTGSIDTSFFCCPGCVQFYIKHNIRLKCNAKQFTEILYLAIVQWYKLHPEKTHFRLPNTLWYPDYVALSEASFIPISRIASRCAQREVEMSFPERPHHNGKAVVICPISAYNSVRF